MVRGTERLPESLLGVIKKKQEEKGLEPLNDIDVRWRLLNGKIASPETRPLLLEAISIFHVSYAHSSEFIHNLFCFPLEWMVAIILFGSPTNGEAVLDFYPWKTIFSYFFL